MKHKDCDVNADTVGLIRKMTDEAGHRGVPFLVDAVHNIIIERDQARESREHSARLLLQVALERLRRISNAIGFGADELRAFARREAAEIEKIAPPPIHVEILCVRCAASMPDVTPSPPCFFCNDESTVMTPTCNRCHGGAGSPARQP